MSTRRNEMYKHNNKLTCITIFDDQSIEKINLYFKNIEFKMCKLKYDENDREKNDKLPFHSTICVWKNRNPNEIKEILKKFQFKEFELKVIGTKIKKSTQNSYNLYFEFEKNEEFIKIQKNIYNEENIRIEKYNPDTFIPHITIHIDKDYERILALQNNIMKVFRPFHIKVIKIGLYEIYPPKKIL